MEMLEKNRNGKVIQEAIKSRGYTQKEIGRLCGMSQQHIGKVVLTGACSLTTLLNVLDKLGYDLVIKKARTDELALKYEYLSDEEKK